MVSQISSMDDSKAKIATPGKVVFVDVFTTWCPGCKTSAPLFEQLSTEHPNCVFIKVDADQVKDVLQEYEVKGFPTFLVFKEGKKVESMVPANGQDLKNLIENHDKS